MAECYACKKEIGREPHLYFKALVKNVEQRNGYLHLECISRAAAMMPELTRELIDAPNKN